MKYKVTARTFAIFASAALVSAVAGCGGGYRLPSTVTATAQLDVQRTTSEFGFGNASNQGLAVSTTGNTCGDLSDLAQFTPLTGSRKMVAVEAGRPLTFVANTMIYTGGAMTGQSWCQSVFSFTPLPNESYRIRHQPAPGGCRAEVVATQTNQPPADMTHLGPRSC